MNVTDSPGPEPSRSEHTRAPAGEGSGLPPKRIYRDPSGPIGGVAGGFAGYFDVDPVISRLLWIVALFSGVGIPAYFVCWLIIPKAKQWPAPGYGRVISSGAGQNNTALLSGFVIIGLVAAIGTGVHGIGEYLLPAALVGFGVYLLGQRAAMAVNGERSPAAESAAVGTALASPATWTAPPEAPSARRTNLVTPSVLSVLAIVVGVLGALHVAGWIHLSIATAAAGGLVIVGGGLLASLWFERARGLVPLGIVLTAVMLAASTFGSWFDGDAESRRDEALDALTGAVASARTGAHGSVGDRTYQPASIVELQPSYEVGVGDLAIDLSQVDFSGQTRDVEVNVGVGQVTLVVPADVAVRVDGDVGVGKVNTFGRTSKGLGVELGIEDRAAGAGQLNLMLHVGMGKVEVRRDNH